MGYLHGHSRALPLGFVWQQDGGLTSRLDRQLDEPRLLVHAERAHWVDAQPPLQAALRPVCQWTKVQLPGPRQRALFLQVHFRLRKPAGRAWHLRHARWRRLIQRTKETTSHMIFMILLLYPFEFMRIFILIQSS